MSGLRNHLGGKGHSEVKCIEACHINVNCNFASHSVQGYCHMTQYCVAKENHETGWYRYQKKTNEGMLIYSYNAKL